MIKDFDKRNQSIIFYKPATPVLATLKIKSLNVVQSKEELKTHFAQVSIFQIFNFLDSLNILILF